MRKVVLALLLVALAASPAAAFDPTRTFAKGSTVLSVEGGAGSQDNLEGHHNQTGLDLWYLGARYSLLPLAPAGPRGLRGSLEVGLEPIVQQYTGPVSAYYAGLMAQARWHFLSLGRLVPYFEGGAAAGGTNLRAIEIDSTFAFLLNFGAGASFFITDRTAVYAGYRMVHISNGNVDTPNRGFEAHTGVVGVSYYFGKQ
ncbi:MAG: acyloxyacyl hydrolase [Candidatus Rokubacteria bacterium]|nr:acyloxyacyl hydrolase [Candidatus Rokubacteria bacterium]